MIVILVISLLYIRVSYCIGYISFQKAYHSVCVCLCLCVRAPVCVCSREDVAEGAVTKFRNLFGLVN
jgi:hypothetical protein